MFDTLKRLFGRGPDTDALSAKATGALSGLLGHAEYELIPLKNVHDQTVFLPEGTAVSVTASPRKGMDATVDLSEQLSGAGFDVVPHVAARSIKDRAQLEGILTRLSNVGIRRAFVIGGDSDEPGEFFDALSLLEAMHHIGHDLSEIGVASYPEGHASISEHQLFEALVDKQPYAHYTTTQMCFDPTAITSWVAEMRARGMTLPVQVGIPGVAPLHRLAAISARIGVGASMRYVSKQHHLIGKLSRPGGYAPDQLLTGLGDALVDAKIDIQGLHIFSFNQVETTEEWRRELLAELARV